MFVFEFMKISMDIVFCGHINVTFIILQVKIMIAVEVDLTFNSDCIVVFHGVDKVLGISC